jgi:hypothetical protein
MQRFAFNLLAGISMLICIATAAFWIRSYWVGDFFPLQDQTHQIVLSRGGMQWQEGLLDLPTRYDLTKPRGWHLTDSTPTGKFGHFSWKSSDAAPGGVTTVPMPTKTFDADGGISEFSSGVTYIRGFFDGLSRNSHGVKRLTVPHPLPTIAGRRYLNA